MNEEIEKRMDDEITRLLDKLADLSPGTKDYDNVMDELKIIRAQRLDAQKAEMDSDEKREKRLYDNGRADEDLRLREEEARIKRDQIELDTRKEENRIAEQKKEHNTRIVLDAIGLGLSGLGLLTYIGVTIAGFKFEEKGVFGSQTLKNFWNRMNPMTLFKKK